MAMTAICTVPMVGVLLLLLIGVLVDETDGAPRVWSISPRQGSCRGGTELRIRGKGFAKNQFNYGENSTLGNRVELYNATTSIPCDVIPYFSNEEVITCETRPAAGSYQECSLHSRTYKIRVYVDSVEITQQGGTYCDRCTYNYLIGYTPVIEKVSNSSSLPGDLVDIYGRAFTSQFGANSSVDESSTKIKRVTFGTKKADLTDSDGNLYGITMRSETSHWGTLKVKNPSKKPEDESSEKQTFELDGYRFKPNDPKSLNVTLFITSNKGKSQTSYKSLRVSAVSGDWKLYHHQTHAEVKSVEPSVGSVEGGTTLTIHGTYFPTQGVGNIVVKVGGEPCEVKTTAASQITCITGKAADDYEDRVFWPGSRGLRYEKWNTYFDSFDDDDGWNSPPDEWARFVDASTDNIQYRGDRYSACLIGFYVPPHDGLYRMAIRSDDSSSLRFALTGDPNNLTEIASASEYTAWNWFHEPTQISDKLALTGGIPYYFEACHREWRGADWIQVGVMIYDALNIVAGDIEDAYNEQQRIWVGTDVVKEEQTLILSDDISADEEFKTTYAGQESTALTSSSSAEEVQDALVTLFRPTCNSLDSSISKRFFNDFENEPSDSAQLTGNRVMNEEAYCGGWSLKNPTRIFEAGVIENGYNGIKNSFSLSTFYQLCFAVRGTIAKSAKFTVEYKHENNAWQTESHWINTFDCDGDFCDYSEWQHKCVDLWDDVLHSDASPVKDAAIKIALIELKGNGQEDFYIDNLFIGNTQLDWNQQPAPQPYVADVNVTKSDSSFSVTMTPGQCEYDLPLLGISETELVTVEREKAATPPLKGQLDVSWYGNTVSVPVNASATKIKEQLERLDTGTVEVVRTGSCYGYAWDVDFTSRGGKQPIIAVDASDVISETGVEVDSSVEELQEGCIVVVLTSEFLREACNKSQVEVYINDIPSVCSGTCTCDFTQSEDNTPTVSGVSPTQGSSGTAITITGSGFSSTAENNEVTIGEESCDITSASESSIECTVGTGCAGNHMVMVNVAPDGYAKGGASFTHELSITQFSPSQGSAAGGTELTITGNGFCEDSTETVTANGITVTGGSVTVGGHNCNVISMEYEQIVCTIVHIKGQASSSSGSRRRKRATTSYTYNSALTPVINTASPPSSSVAGGAILTITGTGFANVGNKVHLNNAECTIITESATDITCTLPPNPPGQYSILLSIAGVGYADTSAIDDFKYILKLDGVSPRSGSSTCSTKVELHGEGFGTDSSMLNITFGSTADCEVMEVADDKILCETRCKSKEHKVTNFGNHIEYGKGYRWKPYTLDITVGDSVVWQWVRPGTVDDNIKFSVFQTVSADVHNYDGTGFNSGQATSSGLYKWFFRAPGTYYYLTLVNIGTDIIEMRGYIIVKAVSVLEMVEVQIKDYSATHDTTQSANPFVDNTCEAETSSIPSATCPDLSGQRKAGKFDFTFTNCSTPQIDAVTPNMGNSATVIQISGTGFGNNVCQNDITFGDHACTPSSVSDTSIKCTLETKNPPMMVGQSQFPSMTVYNRGKATFSSTDAVGFTFLLEPSVTGVSPVKGSTEGGTRITITGDGFSTDDSTNGIMASINNQNCAIESATYTQIICVTSGSSPGKHTVSVRVNSTDAVSCGDECTFEYAPEVTPTVESVTPSSSCENPGSTPVTFIGSNFPSDANDIEVTIGEEVCTVSSASATQIVCNICPVPVGRAEIKLKAFSLGIADFGAGTSNEMTIVPIIYTATPTSGSKEGGTKITMTGSGFHPDDTRVMIDNKECIITSVTLSELICITQKKGAGTYDLLVTSEELAFPPKPFTYSSELTPKVASVDQNQGKTDDTITITGEKFSNTMSDVTVTIDNVECTITSVSETSITCTVGAHPAGTYPIDVNVKDKGDADGDIVFEYLLSIDNTSPDYGSFGGGTDLTITGVGFGNASTTTVLVCDKECPIQSITATNIKCEVPAAAYPSTNADVTCDIVVKVTSSNTEVTMKTEEDAYQFRTSVTSVITDVSPKRGGTAGNTLLTITGTGFKPSGNNVVIAGSECVVESESETLITCRTGSHGGTGKSPVGVVGDYGKAVQKSADFFYVDVWSSLFTWGGENPPVEGDFVVIKKGQTVLLDMDTPVLKMLLLQGGCLIFDDEQASITLHSEYILIVEDGCLQIGTEDKPYTNKAVIKLHGNVRSTELPIYGAKTLAVREGTLDLHGAYIPRTWTYLAKTANPGDTEVTLIHAVTWKTGDQIVIASTGDRHSQKENEEFTITAVSGDGLTIGITPALTYQHISEEQDIEGVTLKTMAEVGLLTRNVVVCGSRNDDWVEEIDACAEEFETGQFSTQTCFQGRFGEEKGSDQYGGQIMIHAPEKDKHLTTGRIEYVEVTHAGQAFRLGRYPIHFHLNGNVTGNYVRGCAIHHTFNRAVTIHAVDSLLVEHNVAYNIMGHAYFLEDGIEKNNIIQYNLAVFVRPSSSLLNVDITPASFWVTNPDNIIRHNAAAGGSHFGYWYNAPKHPTGPSYTSSICPRKIPVNEFFNNTCHSTGWYGLWVFPVYYTKGGNECGQLPAVPAKFFNLTAWNVQRGAELVEVGSVQISGFHISDAEDAGIEFQTTNAGVWGIDGPLLKDSVIIGHSSITDDESCTKEGLKLPKSKYLTVNGVKFTNFDRENCTALACCSHCKPDQGGFQTLFENIELFNSPNIAAFQWEHECWIVDLDGSFAAHLGISGGSTNYKILPTNQNLPSTDCTVDVAALSHGKVKGSYCNANIKFHRLSFNKPHPDSLLYKNATLTNQHGTSKIPYHKKRITHAKGWMTTLISGDTYTLGFQNAEQIANLSYVGTYYDFEPDDFVMLSHEFQNQSPDKFQILPGEEKTSGAAAMLTSDADNGAFYFNEDDKKLTYIVSGKSSAGEESGVKDRDVHLKMTMCVYDDCIIPTPETRDEPPLARPEDFDLWSDTDSWPDGVLPKDGDNVTIPYGVWMVADKALPVMENLTVDGVLELDDSRDFVLNATYILILGRLVVGTVDDPFQHNALIILRGNWSTPEINLPGGPTMGSKAIGVFGGLDLHGKSQDVPWTTLSVTVPPGGQTITVEDNIDWAVGDEIVVTTTSYDPWHTETFAIAARVGKTITLNDTTTYKHLAGSYGTYTMKAEVGLLTRNIQIEGEGYSKLYEESFGARVLVGTFTQGEFTFTGYARISNVEFYHTGQEGFVDFYDPRYSLAFLDIGDVSTKYPSSVTGCSFHHGFSPAIGVYGSNMLTVEGNVIHHTVGPGVVDWGVGNKFVGNLVVLIIFPGTYGDRNEPENLNWYGGISVEKATHPVLWNNHVAGSERAGFKIKGELCDRDGNSETAWKDNVAHSCLHGVQLFFDSQPECSLVCRFTLWRNYDYGIYFQVESSVHICDVSLIENHAGVLPLIMKPAALSHQTSDKHVQVKDSLFVGFSPGFECEDDSVIPEIASFGRSFSGKVRAPDGGHAGFVFLSCMSSSNGAPFMKLNGIKSYPALSCYTDLENVVFSNYTNTCSKRSYAIMTNPDSGDFMHPIRTESITKDSTMDPNSLFFFHRPSLSLVNPADCVDMDCDAMKKVLIRDRDGSFLGNSFSTVVPSSYYKWQNVDLPNDKRRGIGDYRIPTPMLTNPDGSKINPKDKCPNKGIYGTNGTNCEWQQAWQAYKCKEISHRIMIFESTDADTEVRRLSPVALYTDGYVDLINGPQDHGWCHGYTCQERISTFYTMVATGKEYEVYFSSTNPQTMKLHLLNAEDTDEVVVGIFYTNPQRLDIYVEGRYVYPNNGGIGDGGEFVWLEGVLADFKPDLTTSDVNGENYFDRDSSTLYILVHGSTPVSIKTTPVIMVTFGVPGIEVNEFFKDNLIQNLVNFLGIDKSKIRIVDIIAETSRRRRSIYRFGRYRRTAEAEVTLEIGDSPSEEETGEETATTTPETGTTTPEEVTISTPEAGSKKAFDELGIVGATLANSFQDGSISDAIHTEVTSLEITDPIPSPVDPTGGERATNETGGPTDGNVTFAEQQKAAEEEVVTLPKVYLVPSHLGIHDEPVGASESEPFKVSPSIKVFDADNILVTQLGFSSNPWQLTATLKHGDGDQDAKLVGTTSVPFENGFADFTDLAIDKMGSGYTLDFAVSYPDSSSLAVSSSVEISITEREYKAAVITPSTVYKDEVFDVTVEIKDKLTDGFPVGIADKGYTWKATASLLTPSNYLGASVDGTMEATFDVNTDTETAQAHFQDLTIDKKGYLYIIQFNVYTEPPNSNYDFTVATDGFNVKVRGQPDHTGNPKRFELRFNGILLDSLDENDIESLKINFMNKMEELYAVKIGSMYADITITLVDELKEGSIIIPFDVQGNVDGFEDFLMEDLPVGNVKLQFNGQELTADSYLIVDGVEKLGGSSSLFAPWLIAIIVIIALLMLLVTAFIVYWLCFRKKYNKIGESTENISLADKPEKGDLRVESMASVRSHHSALSTDHLIANESPAALSLRDLDGVTVDDVRSISRSNTPRRTPEVAVTSLPPGFMEGQEEKNLEDRRHMSLMALNDDDGTFTKLVVLTVNMVGTIAELRQDISAALLGSKWKNKFIVMKETLKNIPEDGEEKLTVSEIYSSDCVLIRWEPLSGQSRFCVCGLRGRVLCAKCGLQYYCSLHCQLRHLQRHRSVCNQGNIT